MRKRTWGRRRHMPPYAQDPFAGFGSKRGWVDAAKPIVVFDRQKELAFL